MCGDLYFWRQIFILAAPLCFAISTGFMVSYPSVLNAAILSPNTADISTTPATASWIASSNGFAGFFGFLFLPPMMQKLGRRTVNMTCSLLHLIGWIIFPFAKSTDLLYAGRIVQGLSLGGFYINNMISSEYTDPSRRGYFTISKKIATALGTVCCHAMSLRWTWREISCFATVPPCLAIILTYFWPESPSYLAMKGRYDECKGSYTWIFGESPQAQKELNLLISSQMKRRENRPDKKKYAELLEKFTRKDFLKSFCILSLLTIVIDFSGRFFFVAYVIQIMVELLGDKSIAIYCSIGSDCLSAIALLLSIYVIGIFKRRTVLFSFGAASVFTMLLFSLLVFLKVNCNVLNFVWLTPTAILLLNFIVNVGVIPASFALIGEVLPLEHKGLGSCAVGITFSLFYAWSIKLTPVLMESVGLHGTYTIFGVLLGISLIWLYLIVPETKDKTLTEIELEVKGAKHSIQLKNSSKEIVNLI